MADSSLSRQRRPEGSDALRFNPSPTASKHTTPPQAQLSTITARHRNPRATDRPHSDDPFALIPAASYSALAQLDHLVRPCVGDQSRLARLISPVRQSSFAPAAESLLGDGYAHSFAVVVFAVLVNHVRRMLAPALGVGAFGGPIATLKLAVGSPALFLKEETEIGFFGRVFTPQGAWKLLGDVIGTIVFERILVRTAAELGSIKGYSHVKPGDPRTSKRGMGADEVQARAAEKRKIAALVVYLVWILGCAEYLHARAAHVVAVCIAYSKLLRGGILHRQALWEVLLPFTSPKTSSLIESVGGTLSVVGFHLELACFVAWGLYPLMKLAILSTLRMDLRKSRPELAILIAAWTWGTGCCKNIAFNSNKLYGETKGAGFLF
ncbi:hypothetical protein CFIO01_00774 [Colletotrichum fioriniae PJ7]|uniref:Uncharacterized protein n=1 Tax=Colletotrichum fioriniae PJ7 TaxID=1445577 RepID=A0A010QTV9_9PEZI|nr:hypothetical protein CFIO01_00774 [Colletotrichum fioriniae PJ7]